MDTTSKSLKLAKLVTNEVRLNFAHIGKPNPKPKKPGLIQYSVCAMIPKSDKEGIRKFEEAFQIALEESKSIWGGKIPANLKHPLRDGDENRRQYPEFKDMMFFNANTMFKPHVFDADRNEILDPTAIYSGCYGRLNIGFYSYANSNNNGIGVGLNSVQKTRDGEPLFTRTDPSAVFADEDEDVLQ